MIDRPTWQLYVNGRGAGAAQQYADVKSRLVNSLTSILEEPAFNNAPLYPDLWYKERIARDKLRSNAHVLAPGTSLEAFARDMTVSLRDMCLEWVLASSVKTGHDASASLRVGIYLDTGENWMLCGLNPMPPRLPERIGHSPDGAAPNAFDWVRRSLSPVLLAQQMSPPWKDRLRRCGLEMNNAVTDPTFSGMCIVPISHNLQPWRCMGIILLTAFGPEIHPAHLYLLNRLALGVSGYLMPLFPMPGFLWMPEAKLGRGNAVVREFDQDESFTGKVPSEVVRKAAQDMLPTGARVRIYPLRAGYSGAAVYRLNVSDEGNITEVPRVLKVGPADMIETELRAYYRYAHNKKVGGTSRVDIAREFYLSEVYPPPEKDMYGAIIYTLVGAGDEAVPWSVWATGACEEELEEGLRLLWDQLTHWFDRVKRTGQTVVDLMLKPLVNGGLENHIEGVQTNPTFKEACARVVGIYEATRRRVVELCPTCIVHGDLHADNIFAVLSKDKKIRGGALIDWAQVKSERHALSDISKLMVDLAYRVRGDGTLDPWAFEKVREWGGALRCGEESWKVAMIHQLVKIMFYKYGPDARNPYISPAARLRAWGDLNRLAGELTG